MPDKSRSKSLPKVPYTLEEAKMKEPETKGLISIIIPMYNSQLYLAEALDSVLSQTFENWEALLIDDGSTDDTSKIAAEYAKKDARFKYIRKENQGTLWARKIGLENSKGEFIANLDSDDAYKPQFLEKMLAKIKETNSDFVWCDYDDLGKKPIIHGVEDRKFCENKLQNCRQFMGVMWNKLIRRKIYQKVLFPKIRTNNEDYIQSAQIAFYSSSAEFANESLYWYRRDSVASVSNTFNVFRKEQRYVEHVISSTAFYLIMEKLLGERDASILLADKFGSMFPCLFLFSKKERVRLDIQYAQGFTPAFLRGLKESKSKKRLRKFVLILACKGFSLPIKIWSLIYQKVKKKDNVYQLFKKHFY